MRNQIGIFDSGLGGLTVMKAIRKKLPAESLVYFGDTARVPYGGKCPETIVRYTIESAIFLMEQKIKALVIACNTASSYALERLTNIFNIPILDVIAPGAKAATRATRNGKIAVLGTRATIASGAYPKKIQELLPQAEIYPVACPLFVPLVEEKFLHHEATPLIVREYLKGIQAWGADTLLLGCTHYPILAPLIQKELGEGITLVDSASTCADELAFLLQAHDLNGSPPAECRFFVSDDPEKFKELGKDFLGEPIEVCHTLNYEFQP